MLQRAVFQKITCHDQFFFYESLYAAKVPGSLAGAPVLLFRISGLLLRTCSGLLFRARKVSFGPVLQSPAKNPEHVLSFAIVMPCNLFTLFFLALGCCPVCLWAQAVAPVPQLFPSNISIYDIENGLPISCTSDGLIDRSGRFWINPCYSQEEHRTINFYRFDGRNSEFVEWEGIPPEINSQAVLSGFNQKGELYGFFRNTGTCFFFDPATHKSRFLTLDTAGAKVNFIGASRSNGIILHAVSPGNHLIYRVLDDRFEQLIKVPRTDADNQGYFAEWNGYVLTGDDLWISNLKTPEFGDAENSAAQFGTLVRIQLTSRQIQKFTLEDIFHGPPPLVRVNSYSDRIIKEGQRGAVIVYLYAWRQYFVLDPANNTIRTFDPFSAIDIAVSRDKINSVPDIRISKDSAGNLLFLAKYESEYRAVLQDVNGDYFDYSPVVEAARKASRNSQCTVQGAQSRDFRKQVFLFLDSGLAVMDLKITGSIRTCLSRVGIRGIAEMAPGSFVANPDGNNPIYNFFTNSGVSEKKAQPLRLDCLESERGKGNLKFPSNLVRDQDGFIWAPRDQQFIRFRTDSGCTTYFVGKTFVKFAFVDAATITLVADDQLFLYDIRNRQLRPVMADGLPVKFNDVVNQIYVAGDRIVWVAALDGLHKVDLNTGTYRLIGRADGFQNDRMMCIDADAGGRLWIGTYGGGLHIYDPQTGAIAIVDQKKGLSNNIVIGILTDNAGVRWLSTYLGMTLVSANGAVLSRLYAEDGLSTNEFNRYSYLKGSSGELLFGSIAGINIIQPEGVKAQLLEAGPPRIFLTRLSYFDVGCDSLVNKIFWPEKVETIKLPASQRSIRLQFALSSLLRSAENNFAYKLEGPDIKDQTEWTYIGANHDLNLQDLPPGRYNILIRGCDFRGNWTTVPLVIPIHADKFFYRQSWFIVLCIGTVMFLGLAWMYQQKIERERLKQELQHRTQEIIRARNQLVAREKLASLGQLTAGVAYEIKKPLNFINEYALNSSTMADRFIVELEKVKNEIDPDLYKQIAYYIDEMKINALDINDSGSTADRIVRSMMDHARGTSEKMQLLDLNQLIEENVHLAVKSFRANHPDFLVDLDETYADELPHIYGSTLNLTRAVLNILNNALYALNEKFQQNGAFKPALRVQTSSNQQRVFIRIRDNGPGIDQEVLKDIFIPFFTTKPTGEGNTGLGLSICYDIIVSEHKGQVNVESVPGEFTEFVIELPISTDKEAPL
ncbi:MAG: hypothetical protein H6565_02375 [Lewinellaceae bacterium]|nr:hypothetical protein [Lewinellaceae bacterium]